MTSKGKQVALITGASSGIGKETAKQLIKDGLVVYAAARRIEKMEDLAQLGAVVLRMDVTSEEDLVNGVTKINDELGGVDVLVNNAGYAVYGAIEDTTIEDARRQFEVNLFGLARLTQLVLPYMREQRAGKIINISSLGGKIYLPLGGWYHASKHALEGWSDCLRIEVSQFGIDVVIVEPGFVQSEIADVMAPPLMERSGNSAYAAMAKSLDKSRVKDSERASYSHPSVIANVISEAVKSKKPRTRYVAGKLAKPLIFLRRWLPDRMFDRFIIAIVKRAGS